MFAPTLDMVGRKTVEYVDHFGRFMMFAGSTFYWMVHGAVRRGGRMRLLMPQLYQIGTQSLPAMATGAFVGMVLAVEMYDTFHNMGQETRIGGVINVSVLRQIGPVLAAVMIAGRVGGAVSAELGTMRVTEQLDALRVMGADPVEQLAVPRVIACLIMVPALTVFSNLLGVLGGYLVSVPGFGISGQAYWDFSRGFVTGYDLFSGLLKSVFFGLSIGLISCYKGFHCKPGAAGVGKAATDSFVTSFLAIIVLNFFLAKFLKDLHVWVYG